MDETIEKLCNNCNKQILSQNFLTHTVHCQRNLIVCKLCGENINKEEEEKHLKEHRKKIDCKYCKRKIESWTIPLHVSFQCEEKPTKCSFCEIELAAKNINEHQDYCGTRSEVCSDCNEPVMFKYKQLHRESNHNFFKLDDEPGPSPSWKGIKTENNDSFLLDLPNEPNYNLMDVFLDSISTDNNQNKNNFEKLDNNHETNNSRTTNITLSSPASGAIKRSPSRKKYLAPLPPIKKQLDCISSFDKDPSIYLNKNENEIEEPQGIKLPCEYCQEEIDSNELVSHENECFLMKEFEPNLILKLKKTTISEDTGKLNNKNRIKNNFDTNAGATCLSPKTTSHNFDVIELPCEFCNSLYPAMLLLEHQTLCKLNV